MTKSKAVGFEAMAVELVNLLLPAQPTRRRMVHCATPSAATTTMVLGLFATRTAPRNSVMMAPSATSQTPMDVEQERQKSATTAKKI